MSELRLRFLDENMRVLIVEDEPFIAIDVEY